VQSTSQESALERKPLLPPFWFLVAILLMVAMHFLVPGGRVQSGPARLAGVLVILLGLALVVRADRQFRRASTTIKPFEESAALVTDGVYRICRNPIYLGMALVLCGVGLALGGVAPFLVVPLFAWWITTRFIVVEERMLAARFPREYEAYRARTRRWL
jgi:protein-S-isoprenylcysteine O-methyltransferase Ste14